MKQTFYFNKAASLPPDMLEFSEALLPHSLLKDLALCNFRGVGGKCGVNKYSPLEVAGLPGSAADDEIMRNVCVCLATAPRLGPGCSAVLFDCPLSTQGHQSSTGKLRA